MQVILQCLTARGLQGYAHAKNFQEASLRGLRLPLHWAPGAYQAGHQEEGRRTGKNTDRGHIARHRWRRWSGGLLRVA
jgi:hypothetical protein